MNYSPDVEYHLFNITDIRGDWPGDQGETIRDYASKCLNLQRWVWWYPNSAGWAGLDLWVLPGENHDIKDSECITWSIRKAGGPDNSFCFEGS